MRGIMMMVVWGLAVVLAAAGSWGGGDGAGEEGGEFGVV
jgi:hypothetical protein